jgi:hypothetical protein
MERVLQTLRESLRRTEERMEEDEAQVRAGQEQQHCVRMRFVEAEQRELHAIEQYKRVVQQIEVLRTLISSQREHSPTLTEQAALLQEQRLFTRSLMQSAMDQANVTLADLRHARRQLAEAKQERAAAQREWETIAKQLTCLSLQSLRR